jgi:hypothetical protein
MNPPFLLKNKNSSRVKQCLPFLISSLLSDGYHSILYPQSWTQVILQASMSIGPHKSATIRSRNAAPRATTIWKGRGPGTTRKIDPALETGRGAGAVPILHVGNNKVLAR